MGLDVYLRHCPDWKDSIQRQEEYGRREDDVWNEATGGKKYEELTDAEKDAGRAATKALAAELGLGEFGEAANIVDAEIPANYRGFEHPGREKNIFELGYFRSSYNASGINSQADMLGFMSLYDIFTEAGNHEDYYVPIDWEAALERVDQALESIKAASLKRPGNVFVIRIAPNLFNEETRAIKTEKDALRIYEQHYQRWGRGDSPFGRDGYGSSEGEFYPKGVRVKAFINGAWPYNDQMSAVYAICEREENDDGDEYDPLVYAAEAYEMVKLTIQWVLDQEDPSQYRLAWSG